MDHTASGAGNPHEHRQANRLFAETSPYLLQHAHNPVDWFPWGPEALARAAGEDRPIFLSIGYSACHWCHVMERESFEDEATAAALNADFVSIKVDREERPDLDAVYMAAVQAITGGGGWPMSLFLTPDGRPFHGGTYFPAEPRYGMPSFRQTLAAVARTWRERREDVESAASLLAEGLRRQNGAGGAGAIDVGPSLLDADAKAPAADPAAAQHPPLDAGTVELAVSHLIAEFDFGHGGWGGAPRFPQPATLELLVRRARAKSDPAALATAVRALDVMAGGGIRDHLGGGFHRYATDTNWLVPHFEKMLYDNAQLALVYLHAYQLTGELRFREVAETTLDYMAAEMTTPDGLFASSQDADTDGVEGATYVWTAEEVAEVLADPGATALFAAAYGVTAAGNWEDRTILSRVASDAELAARFKVPAEAVATRLARSGELLQTRRLGRPQPGRDDKAVTAWNGMALTAFAEAIPVLGRDGDRRVAERAADAALNLLRNPDGRLARSFRLGRASGLGGLEDYAALAGGLLAMFEATFGERWLVAAHGLIDVVLTRFTDPAGGWFDTADDAERLLVRPHEIQDGATPSGGATAAAVMLRLAELTGESHLRAAAERAIAPIGEFGSRYPRAFAAWLAALDFAVTPITQVAIVGEPDDPETRALVAVARAGFQPYRIVVAGDPSTSGLDLLQSRFRLDGRATAFVCRDFACRRPVVEPVALAAELA